MIISILHLSDIHFKNGHNVILNRRDKIFQIIKNEIRGKDGVLILTSGDIAFSGKTEEYTVAIDFYKNLNNDIKEYTSLIPNFLFVPGNHDCIFNKEHEEVRKIILE